MKICPLCGTMKPLTEFKPESKPCKKCLAQKAAAQAKYRSENREVIAASKAKYRSENRDKINKANKRRAEAAKEKDLAAYQAKCAARRKRNYLRHIEERRAKSAVYRAANKEVIAARKAAHHAANPEIMQERSVRRKRTVANQTPTWADRTAVLAIYREAREFRKAGVPATVDHIVPLRGKLVSGLHCEANLTIKLASWNFGKCNRFDPLTFDNGDPLSFPL